MGIELIQARSPQAKGRVERLFGTLQERLAKVLGEAGATNLADANHVLLEFLPKFNARFPRPYPQPGSAFVPWDPSLPAEQVFCWDGGKNRP